MCERKGFTLVELLTVISIICLLMAILSPIVSRARRTAQAGVCLSNLRQWGMVYKMYTDEFDGRPGVFTIDDLRLTIVRISQIRKYPGRPPAGDLLSLPAWDTNIDLRS